MFSGSMGTGFSLLIFVSFIQSLFYIVIDYSAHYSFVKKLDPYWHIETVERVFHDIVGIEFVNGNLEIRDLVLTQVCRRENDDFEAAHRLVDKHVELLRVHTSKSCLVAVYIDAATSVFLTIACAAAAAKSKTLVFYGYARCRRAVLRPIELRNVFRISSWMGGRR